MSKPYMEYLRGRIKTREGKRVLCIAQGPLNAQVDLFLGGQKLDMQTAFHIRDTTRPYLSHLHNIAIIDTTSNSIFRPFLVLFSFLLHLLLLLIHSFPKFPQNYLPLSA
jgi:hypothetical protein